MASESSATIEKPSTTLPSRTGRTLAAVSPWSDAAPARLSSIGSPEDDSAAWLAWQKHLTKRRRPRPITELVSGKTHPLLWNLPDDIRVDEVVALLPGRPTNGTPEADIHTRAVQDWLVDEGRAAGATEAIYDLALAHLLPRLAGTLDRQTWWSTLTGLCRRASQRRDASLDENADGEAVWLDQLTSGELPLTLASCFPELRACAELLPQARRCLSDGLVSLTDGEGLLHARHLPWLRPLLACWTRCLALAEAGGTKAWGSEADVQYEWLVRQSLRLTRGDGSQLLGAGPTCDWQPGLFRTALELAGDDEDFAAAELSLPNDAKIGEADELPCSPSVGSEWSQLAVLRTDWSRAAPRLAVSYTGRDVTLELEVGRETLLAGVWQLEVTSNGKPLARHDAWEEVCWYSDDDVDYLEISTELAAGGRVERQVLLAREDRFLFLCDNIIGASGSIECTSTLPLSESISIEAEKDTRELTLLGKKPRGLVMPIALSEWKTDSRYGTLELTGTDGHRLQLRQTTPGHSLACPLFIDLLPRRFQKQRTWRQLTVAESLELCPRETAVAYRVQSGIAQWIFYRTLAPPANRTFVGQNVATEFFAARFHRDGEVEELLEIEGEE